MTDRPDETESDINEVMERDFQEIHTARNVDQLVDILRHEGMAFYWLRNESRFPKQSARLLNRCVRYKMTNLQRDSATELPDPTDWMAVIRWTNLVLYPAEEPSLDMPTLTEDEIEILDYLKEECPQIRHWYEIAAIFSTEEKEKKGKKEKGRKAIEKHLNILMGYKLASRPDGRKKGYAITDQGKQYIEKYFS